MDFFTIDTILGRRFYVFFILYLKTRQIVRFGVTDNPTRLFVRQQLIEFRWDFDDGKKVYLIHDGSDEFKYINYKDFNITNIKISPNAPNMNAYCERFVKSARNEAFDWFIIFNERQLRKILKKYITYFNQNRPHQGISQEVPEGYVPQKKGKVLSHPMLWGLQHHYYRLAA